MQINISQNGLYGCCNRWEKTIKYDELTIQNRSKTQKTVLKSRVMNVTAVDILSKLATLPDLFAAIKV